MHQLNRAANASIDESDAREFKLIGKSSLTQVTVGFQLGGQAYSEIVFFQTRQALDNFKLGHLKLDAQASAVAVTERASRDLAYRDGVAIVTMVRGGRA